MILTVFSVILIWIGFKIGTFALEGESHQASIRIDQKACNFH